MANNNYRFIFLLNSCFGQSSVEGIIKTLEKDDTEWALKQIEVTFIHITVETSHTLAILGTMESDFSKRLK